MGRKAGRGARLRLAADSRARLDRRTPDEFKSRTIIGTIDECHDKLAHYAWLGIDEVVGNMSFGIRIRTPWWRCGAAGAPHHAGACKRAGGPGSEMKTAGSADYRARRYSDSPFSLVCPTILDLELGGGAEPVSSPVRVAGIVERNPIGADRER